MLNFKGDLVLFGQIPDALLFGSGAFLAEAPVLIALAKRLPAMLERGWGRAPADLHCTTGCSVLPAHWLDALLALSLLLCNIAVIYAWGLTFHGLAAIIFCAVLLTLARIDAAEGLLPDLLTLPLMWLGMLFHLAGGWLPLPYSVAGAALGYLLLWLVFVGFRWKTGRDGMGYGDFKLAAALGAWLGVQALPVFLPYASLAGAQVGLLARCFAGLPSDRAIPFGPFLVLAGILVLFSDFAPRA